MKRSWLVAVTRLANAAYFVGSAVYCLLSYSPFAYAQFIEPQLLGWLPSLVAHHHNAFWATLVVTTPTLWPTLRAGRRPERLAAVAYLAFHGMVGLWLLFNPVLVLAGPNARTLTFAILWLVPPLALAALDHRLSRPPAIRLVEERRLFLSTGGTALAVWLTYTALLPWYVPRTVGISVPATALGLAAGVSLVSHLLIFALAHLTVSAALSVGALIGRGLAEYWALCCLWVAAVALVLDRVVAAALSFQRAESLVLSIWLSVVLVAVWSGIAWQQHERARHAGRTDADAHDDLPEAGACDAVDLWFTPITWGRRPVAVAGIIALPVLAWTLRQSVAQFDWNFLLQKLGVGLVWAVAAGWVSLLVRRGTTPQPRRQQAWPVVASIVVVGGLAGTPLATRVASWTGDARLDPEFVLDRYSSLDASYQLVRHLLRTSSDDNARFYTFLKAHSTLGTVDAQPVDVRFVESFRPTPRPPHIFLFIVDSLRRDYLAPYNSAVTFTPATRAFAAESIVFERAFSRYGATGLSVPALWAGGLLLHKQYVKPFAPMNALEKLIDAAGYRRFMSDDHLVTALFRPSPATTLLDERLQEMDHTLCATTRELRDRMDGSRGDPRPIFAMTRPLQLHMARLVRDAPTDQARYPGFVPGYAAQVAALDRCFGEFVAYLKTTGLYDESVIVLTSDHGESLGEDGRWGHAYTLYPEVVRVPLIVHLPASAAARLATDRSRVALSTDITPSLYVLAGQQLRDPGDLYGEPLFTPATSSIVSRRREAYLLSSSYGPVYGLLRHNGRSLYVADAVQGKDMAFEMDSTGAMRRVTVTDASRAVNRAQVRQQIEQIAAEYKFSPGR